MPGNWLYKQTNTSLEAGQNHRLIKYQLLEWKPGSIRSNKGAVLQAKVSRGRIILPSGTVVKLFLVLPIDKQLPGQVAFMLNPGDYLVIGKYIDASKPTIYVGVSVGEITPGSVVNKYLQVLQTVDGTKLFRKI